MKNVSVRFCVLALLQGMSFCLHGASTGEPTVFALNNAVLAFTSKRAEIVGLCEGSVDNPVSPQLGHFSELVSLAAAVIRAGGQVDYILPDVLLQYRGINLAAVRLEPGPADLIMNNGQDLTDVAYDHVHRVATEEIQAQLSLFAMAIHSFHSKQVSAGLAKALLKCAAFTAAGVLAIKAFQNRENLAEHVRGAYAYVSRLYARVQQRPTVEVEGAVEDGAVAVDQESGPDAV